MIQNEDEIQQKLPALVVEASATQQQLPALAADANTLVICDDVSYAKGGAGLKIAKEFIKTVQAKFKKPKDSAYKTHQDICRLEKEIIEKAESSCEVYQRKMLDYSAEQERIAREVQAKLEAEQRKREEEARLAEAAEAEASGDKALAEQIIEAPMPVAPVVVPSSTPKIAGLSSRENWKAEVTDKAALIKFVAANPSWLHLLEVSTKEINSLARSQKSAMAIPGVRAFAKTSLVSRGSSE